MRFVESRLMCASCRVHYSDLIVLEGDLKWNRVYTCAHLKVTKEYHGKEDLRLLEQIIIRFLSSRDSR